MKARDWGFRELMPLSSLLDNDLLDNGELVISAKVEVLPRYVLDHARRWPTVAYFTLTRFEEELERQGLVGPFRPKSLREVDRARRGEGLGQVFTEMTISPS